MVVLYTTADVAFQGVGFIDIYFCKFLYNSPDKFSRNPWPVVAGGGRLKRNLIYRNEKKNKIYIFAQPQLGLLVWFHSRRGILLPMDLGQVA